MNITIYTTNLRCTPCDVTWSETGDSKGGCWNCGQRGQVVSTRWGPQRKEDADASSDCG